MKKLFLVLLPVLFLFSACKDLNAGHFLIVTSDSNIYENGYNVVFLNKNNKVLSSSEKLAYNTKIVLTWSLLPESMTTPSVDEVTIIQEPETYLKKVSNPTPTSIEYIPLDVGDTVIKIQSEKYSSATIRIRVVAIN